MHGWWPSSWHSQMRRTSEFLQAEENGYSSLPPTEVIIQSDLLLFILLDLQLFLPWWLFTYLQVDGKDGPDSFSMFYSGDLPFATSLSLVFCSIHFLLQLASSTLWNPILSILTCFILSRVHKIWKFVCRLCDDKKCSYRNSFAQWWAKGLIKNA